MRERASRTRALRRSIAISRSFAHAPAAPHDSLALRPASQLASLSFYHNQRSRSISFITMLSAVSRLVTARVACPMARRSYATGTNLIKEQLSLQRLDGSPVSTSDLFSNKTVYTLALSLLPNGPRCSITDLMYLCRRRCCATIGRDLRSSWRLHARVQQQACTCAARSLARSYDMRLDGSRDPPCVRIDPFVC